MKLTTNSVLIAFAIILLGLMACFPVALLALPALAATPPAVDPAATVQAIVSQTSVAMTQTAPTQTPVPPTATSAPLTATPVTYCDWVAFVGDVTVPDGSVFSPGETFTKVWRLKNRGTCAWTIDYKLAFTGGNSMGSTTLAHLPVYVGPGQTVDVAVNLTAPSTPGHYTGYWSMKNASGVLFGYGDKADKAFYVDIIVRSDETPAGTVTGSICYPSEFNPPMTLYFEKVGSNQAILLSIPEDHPTYNIVLPAGKYYVWAWAPGYNLEGGYTHANGTLKSFYVYPDETTSGIRICDWSPYSHNRGD
jgi:hypothetical protein